SRPSAPTVSSTLSLHDALPISDSSSMRLGADEGGDEPVLLARRLPGVPVIVGTHRYAAGRHAVARFGVSALVLDDGFQHRTLAKDLEIVMARARAPWGSGRLLPGGPLREPLAALARAHLIVVAGARGPGDVGEVAADAPWRAALRAGGAAGAALRRRRVAGGVRARGSRALPMTTALAIRLPNWLGDTVMAEPAVRALRRAHPQARVLLAGPWATLLGGQ